MHVRATEDAGRIRGAVDERRPRIWLWACGAVLLTMLVAASRLLVTPTFYFADDTQTGTAGQWWQLGGEILAGRLPLLDVHAWTAGNILAEGQWGVFNPAIWLIAVAFRLVAEPVLVITVVKILALGVMAAGALLLARSFGAATPWAAAAGVLVPLGGFTVYMDAASWTTGLFASALLPWVWFGLREYVDGRRGPLAYVVTVVLLVTLGYVFGVIVLIVVFAEMLLRAIARRERTRAVRVLVAGAFATVLTVAVYLPGILTASVTIRDSTEILNTGFLNADLTDVAAVGSATVTGSIGSWGTGATAAPLMYALWALPLLALFPPTRRRLAQLAPLLWIGLVLLLVVVGPDQAGPIRWPVRFMPYVVLVMCVLFCAIASDATVSGRRARRGLAGGAVIAGLIAVLTYANTPWQWRQVLLTAAVHAVGLLLVWYLTVRDDPRRRSTELTAMVTGAIGLLLVVPQMYIFPATTLPRIPGGTDIESMRGVPGDVPDDAIVVGNIYAGWDRAETFDERLVANQWYFSDVTVSSLYTVLPHRGYVTDLCADLRGSTCPEAFATLTGTDPLTQKDVAELLGVNTLIVMNSSFDGHPPAPPEGWSLWRDGDDTQVMVRDEPVATAGGVTWSGEGTEVTELGRTATDLTLKIDSVGEDARVVLSRIDWPGYRIDGADVSDSVRGYLLTLDVSDRAPGDVVTVSFRPPGWQIEIAALAVSLSAAVMWPLWWWLRRRRPRTTSAAAEEL